jgi:uncharacterized protein
VIITTALAARLGRFLFRRGVSAELGNSIEFYLARQRRVRQELSPEIKMKKHLHALKFIPALTIVALALATLLSGCSTCCDQNKSAKRVLVVSTTTGFRHSCIPTMEKTLSEMAQKSGAFTVEFAGLDTGTAEFKNAEGKPDNAKIKAAVAVVLAEKMSAAALKTYDAVIFANTTGDLPLPDPQAFVDWVKSGKGFVGVHAATDTFHGFRPYIEMIGGEFKTHGPQVEVELINQDAAFPACRHISTGQKIFDEIYQMKSFSSTNVHGLLTLDKLALGKDPNDKKPGDYPVAWCSNYGKGRVFYTSLGHREDVWDATYKDGKGERKNSPEVALMFQQHLLGGIKWALGLEKGNATPQK